MKQALHILIVDDDQDDTEFLVEAFSKCYPQTRFTTLKTGQDALNTLIGPTSQRDCPDVAFLDLHMPGKSGYEVLAALRASERCRSMPIMIVSTSMLQMEAERCRQAGCTDYFIKPVSLEDYEAIVMVTVDHILLSNDELAQYAYVA